MKSRKSISKILIALEDKREYVLSNEKIVDKNIRATVKFCDNVMIIIESLYDDIISNKGIVPEHINDRIDTLNNQIKSYKEKTDE